MTTGETGVAAALDELAIAARRRDLDHAADRRPRCSPVAVVADLVASLGSAGVVVELTAVEHDLAVMRAAELLAALGVAAAQDRHGNPQ